MDVPPIHIRDAALNLRGSSKELGDELLLALLRRQGRVLLLGPPGCGKSTALRQVAAWYARNAEGPFPLYVPLPLLEPRAPERLLDQVLKLSVSQYARDDADLVEEGARQRLREGRVALLLDGLDECAEHRRVLASLSEVLAELHPDVEIVLATRDSAYRSARTLGFHEVRLKPPSNLSASLRDCARQFALARGVPANEVTPWCELRLQWVAKLREQDALLQETPLMGILLIGIACEVDSEEQLPHRRADVLSTVVERAARRWELAHRRGEQSAISTFTGTDVESILLAGFEEIAHHAYPGGPVARGVIILALEDTLRLQWGLAPGQANSTAQQVLIFWEEAGAFISDAADGQVRPRIRLLAELGEARHALKWNAKKVPSWVEQHLASNSSEVLTLAAGLSPAMATTLIHEVAKKPRPEWLLLAARAIDEGASPTPEALELIVLFLRGRVTPGLPTAWPFVRALAQLPLPPALHAAVLNEFEHYLPKEYGLCARALAFTNWKSVAQAQAPVWRDFLGMPPLRAVQKTPSGSDLRSKLFAATIDNVYTHTLARVSRQLLKQGENGDAERIARAAAKSSIGGRTELMALLEQFGHRALVEGLNKQWQTTFTQFYKDMQLEADAWMQYLQIIAGLQPATARYRDRRRLESIAAFSQATVPGHMLAGVFEAGMKHREDVPDFLHTLAILGGLDVGKLAGEARALLEEPEILRRAIHGGKGPGVEFRHWDSCNAPSAVRQSLIQWLSHSFWFADRSVEALRHAPSPEETVEAAVRALPSAYEWSSSLTVNLIIKLSAHALPLLRHWGTHPDILRRRGAAHALAAMWKRQDGLVSVQDLRSPLLDEDMGVRKTVEKALAEAMRHQALAAVVRQAAMQLPTQWHCRRCGYTSHNVTAPACEKCGAQDDR
nr:NACHT domain-containing protein [Corallococcus exiguus]